MEAKLLEAKSLKYTAEQIINLELETNKKVIIQDLNFSIAPGEFVGLVGPNGSGKTTISKLLTRIIEPTSGTIMLNGQDYEELDAQWQLHQKVSLVFQNVDAQFIAPNFVEDLSLYLGNFGWSKEKIQTQMDKVVTELGLQDLVEKPFKNLSGGQKQLLAIAEALAVDPELLILDEPTAQLDPENSQLVFKVINKLRQNRKVAILLITHKITELSLTERVLILNQGKLSKKMKTNDLLLNPTLLKENQLSIPVTVEIINKLSHLIDRPLNLADPSLGTFIETLENIYVNSKKS
ncbi:energy-coupling factor ABC transporter ATP-binding protein [Xylocopilactobacillus apicola]|uniref:Energy-coupling factor transporter ATP-binding protein EcfA1 n=1 Tax=Xylocopilactobacillus apicola TaxID=2932184 RepID=A0AAU9D358_9LACO|nr:energy-coupling factor ABC transporter ATP-binding protein [Xylocopilactobacillus apicola]BDR58209.1 energy-coupling factor transporter ATP-binding protein EcfA1 [Xylocopilactobacillus apicola]